MSSARRAGREIVRALTMAIAGLALVLSAGVTDAASKVEGALSRAHAAEFAEPEAQRIRLSEAAAMLETAWSAPLHWHAGAQEAMSWIEARRAEAGAGELHLRRSVDYAAAAVRASPMQPLAWMRLAAAEQRGASVAVCERRRCLENSWRAAPMLEADLACARIGLARAAATDFTSVDVRLQNYLASRPAREDIASCLGFLPSEQLYELLLAERLSRRN